MTDANPDGGAPDINTNTAGTGGGGGEEPHEGADAGGGPEEGGPGDEEGPRIEEGGDPFGEIKYSFTLVEDTIKCDGNIMADYDAGNIKARRIAGELSRFAQSKGVGPCTVDLSFWHKEKTKNGFGSGVVEGDLKEKAKRLVGDLADSGKVNGWKFVFNRAFRECWENGKDYKTYSVEMLKSTKRKVSRVEITIKGLSQH